MNNQWPLPYKDERGKPLSEPTEAQLEQRKKFQEMLRPSTAPTMAELMDRPAKSYAQGVAAERARVVGIVTELRDEVSSYVDRSWYQCCDEILRRIREEPKG